MICDYFDESSNLCIYTLYQQFNHRQECNLVFIAAVNKPLHSLCIKIPK